LKNKKNMSVKIHNTAIVSPKAQLGENVSIGAFSIIEENAKIGDGTEICNNCFIGKNTQIGKENKIFSSAIIGSEPQDLKYKGEKTNLIVGDRNLIREFVTMNNGTNESGVTIVGNDNAFLAYSHVAHDCKVGNNIVMSNIVQLGGHVTIEDGVVLGGLAAVHQFCVIGKFSMIAANAIIVKDVAPYSTIDREPNFHGINRVGLQRRGFSAELIRKINDFYVMIFRSGLNNSEAIKKYISENEGNISPEIQYSIDFIQNSNRGVTR
jgi:UDP-N-acetylglucosamine acyltransferase